MEGNGFADEAEWVTLSGVLGLGTETGDGSREVELGASSAVGQSLEA